MAMVRDGAAVTAVVAVISGGANPAALRLLLVATDCIPGHRVESARYSLSMAPLQLSVGGSLAFGAVVGNLALMMAVTLLMACVVQLLAGCRHILPPALVSEDPRGAVLFPSIPLLVFQALVPGTSLAACDLIMNGRGLWDGLIGGAVMAGCLGITAGVFTAIQSHVPQNAYVMPASRRWQRVPFVVEYFLIGDGEWVSRRPENQFAYRMSAVLEPYKQDLAWFGALEAATTFAIAAIHSAVADNWTGCGHIKVAAGAIFAVILVVEARYWPHNRHRNAMLDVVILGTQASAMFCFAAGYYSAAEGHGGFDNGSALFLVCMALLQVRVGLDVLSCIMVLVMRRQIRLQAAAYEEADVDEGKLSANVREGTPRGSKGLLEAAVPPPALLLSSPPSTPGSSSLTASRTQHSIEIPCSMTLLSDSFRVQELPQCEPPRLRRQLTSNKTTPGTAPLTRPERTQGSATPLRGSLGPVPTADLGRTRGTGSILSRPSPLDTPLAGRTSRMPRNNTLRRPVSTGQRARSSTIRLAVGGRGISKGKDSRAHAAPITEDEGT